MPSHPADPPRDRVDEILDQWARERPDLDASPIAVIGRISRAARLLERGVERELTAHGLDLGRFDVLVSLRRGGPPYAATAGELAAVTMIAKASTTHRVDLLVRDGLVERVDDPGDGRRSVVRLTDRGRTLVEHVMERHVANEARLLAHLSATEQAGLADHLRALLAPLERPT